jgi:hypothetical protein
LHSSKNLFWNFLEFFSLNSKKWYNFFFPKVLNPQMGLSARGMESNHFHSFHYFQRHNFMNELNKSAQLLVMRCFHKILLNDCSLWFRKQFQGTFAYFPQRTSTLPKGQFHH